MRRGRGKKEKKKGRKGKNDPWEKKKKVTRCFEEKKIVAVRERRR